MSNMNEGTGTIIGAAIETAGNTILGIAGLAKNQVVELSSASLTDLNKMKSEYGTGVSTLISVENATGAYIDLVDSRLEVSGHLWKYPVPPTLGPGQIGVFLHVRSTDASRGSIGSVVYRIKGPDKKTFDAYLGWNNPYDHNLFPVAIYCELKPSGHWSGQMGGSGSEQKAMDWMTDNKLWDAKESKSHLVLDRCELSGSIGNYTSPVCQFHLGYEAA